MPPANARNKLKTSFKKARVVGPVYTGGPVAITQDGARLVTTLSEEVLLSEVASGEEICRFTSDTEDVTSLALTPTGTQLAVFSASLSLRIFDIPNNGDTKSVQPSRVVSRAHDAPVHVCTVDPTSTYLASGSADGVVKVWDLARGFITHVFKGHGGVVSALKFSLSPTTGMQLFTASLDTRIRVYDLAKHAAKTGGVVKPDILLEGHVSVPRGLDVSSDGRWLVSGGRDSVVLVWDLADALKSLASSKPKQGKGKAKESSTNSTPFKTIPILESVEACGLIRTDDEASSSNGGLVFYTAGASGAVKVWDCNTSKVLYTLGMGYTAVSDDEEERQQIMQALYLPSQSTIVSVHADQNILFHSLSTRSLVRQLIGFNDEIVDATFLSPRAATSAGTHDTHVALATNSSLIRLYSTNTSDARLLEGHADIVLCLDHSADSRILVSGSKDRSARIWVPTDSEGDARYHCVGICEGHAESVGAIAMSRSKEPGSRPLLFTGSQDRTIKMWEMKSALARNPGDEPVKCSSIVTLKAHDKDINSLDVAPNDRLLVSGSQDRTAKVWAIDTLGELRLLGTCKGHKRGVWSVRFGTAERVLATGSGDKTVKLWNLDDYTCVKTFEGHTNSVLRVDFFNAGMQMVSSASDGLVKIWNVWALAVSSDERLVVSGAADSVVTFWEDNTVEAQKEVEDKRTEMVEQEQLFQNYLSLHDYKKAIQISISLSQPGRLLSLFRTVGASAEDRKTSITGSVSVDEVLRTLNGAELCKLLRFVRDWNANAKTSAVAQRVLYAIVKLRAADEVMAAFTEEQGEAALASGDLHLSNGAGSTALREVIEALVPYTERHLARMGRLVQDSYMIDYILGEMDDGALSVAASPVVPFERDPTLAAYFQPTDDPALLEPANRLRVDSQPTRTSIFTRTKTTRRTVYDAARQRADVRPGDPADVLLYNEDGAMTEASISNIAFFRDSYWFTPPLSTGCLPGVLRGWLLEQGRIREATFPIRKEDVREGEWVMLTNGVNGCRFGKVTGA
ncbi:WD40-repeat-containing domain protein [Schizophyllum fasciatum]